MQPLERRSVFAIAGVAMLRMFGLFTLLPVLAVYASGLAGATPLLVGIAVGGYGLTQAALQIPFGTLSDRIGRKPVIWLGLLIFALGSVVAGLSDGIGGMIAGRLLQGAGAVSATLSALLADVTRPDVRTRSMAILGIGIGTSFLLALVFGPLIASEFGTRSLFWLAIILSGLAGLVLTQVAGGHGTTVAPRSPMRSAFLPALLRLDFFVFLLHAILTALFVALPLMLQEGLGLPLGEHWLLYVGAIGASLVGTVPLILADERSGKASTMLIAILLLIAGLVLLAVAASGWWAVFGALAMFFAGFNFLEASLPARLSLLAPQAIRGSAMGVFSSAQFLGAFAGGVTGGALYSSFGAAGVFRTAALVGLLWLLLQLVPRKHA